MAYLGNSPLNSLFSVQPITLAQGQTDVVASYTPGRVVWFKNGTLLTPGVDITATNGSTATLANPASGGDVLVGINLASFAVANALPLAGGTLTGPAQGVTPNLFTNDKQLATTEFVQRALGGMSATTVVDASRALTAADVNKYLAVSGGITLSLPAVASVVPGAVIEMGLTAAGITVTSSETKILLNGTGAATGSVPVRGGSHARFLCTGSFWIFLGTAALGWDAGFASSLVGNGYQKLPSGNIEQWMTVSNTNNLGTGFSGTNFPIPFPNACLGVNLTALTSSGGGYEVGFACPVGWAASNFSWVAYTAAGSPSPNAAQTSVFARAVGY